MALFHELLRDFRRLFSIDVERAPVMLVRYLKLVHFELASCLRIDQSKMEYMKNSLLSNSESDLFYFMLVISVITYLSDLGESIREVGG